VVADNDPVVKGREALFDRLEPEPATPRR
jgi:hypothetical protein